MDLTITTEVDPLLPPGEILDGSASVRNFCGLLLWLARSKSPDISCAVHRVSRLSHASSTGDWELVRRIAKYLKGTKDVKLRLNQKVTVDIATVELTSNSDADIADDRVDRKSISGWIYCMKA